MCVCVWLGRGAVFVLGRGQGWEGEQSQEGGGGIFCAGEGEQGCEEEQS